ncbi:hypothetical protein TNCV_2330411 [Trichonephila clavipes]|nr:hypothetical protein TNCV_2330411 [Trichonephila clavipes]
MNCTKKSVGITKCSNMVSTNPNLMEKIGISIWTSLSFRCLIAFDLLHPDVGNAVFSEYKLLQPGSCSISSSSSSESHENSNRLFIGTSSFEKSTVGD